MKYQTIYKTSVFLLFLGFIFILGSTFMLANTQTSAPWDWVIYSSSFIMLLSSIMIVFFREESSKSLKLDYRERKIIEDERALELKQNQYQSSLSVLAQKEDDVKQKLMQYQQFAEFPDDNKWGTDGKNTHLDNEIAQLLQDKAEIIFEKIINKRYTEKKAFKSTLLLEDIADLIESVARIHHPDSQHPILETSIENLLQSLNRLSLQLLVLVDSFPINIKQYNLKTTYLYIQKSATTIGYYKKAEPFLTFVTPILRIGLASNPIVGIAQTVAIEAGKVVIKKGSEKYALNLLHDIIEIIGEQATTIFGEGSFRYRNLHWIYAIELAEIIFHFNPVNSETLATAMKIINGLPMQSEYDRIFIYQCLAQGKSVNPEKFSNDFCSEDDIQELINNLTSFVEDTINKNSTEKENSWLKKVTSWRNKAEQRLGIKIALTIDKNDVEYLKNKLSSGSPEKKVKPFMARTILAMLEEQETPQFIYTDIIIETQLKKESLPQALECKELWLIGTNRRLILLSVDKANKTLILWRYDSRNKESISIHRINRVVADDCKVIGGIWQVKLPSDIEPELILEGRNISSYDSYFQVLEDFIKIIS
jgi:hypothetical protein